MIRTTKQSIDLSDLIKDPAKVAEVDPDSLAPMLAQLTTMQASMTARLVTERGTSDAPDRLLTVAEAAERLGVSKD